MLINKQNCSGRNEPLLFLRIENYYDWILDNTRDATYCKAPHFGVNEEDQKLSKCPIYSKPRATDSPSITKTTLLNSQTSTYDTGSNHSLAHEDNNEILSTSEVLQSSSIKCFTKSNITLKYFFMMYYGIFQIIK